MAHERALHVLLGGVRIGMVREERSGRLRFFYNDAWTRADAPQSVSLSLPYTQSDHTHRPVHAYMSNLLPDNREILQGWAAQFGVSDRNPFALLAHMGEDCAGAVQFVREDRLHDALSSPGTIVPLSEDEIAAALKRIRRYASPWAETNARTGAFSLAGAQAKIALADTGRGWGRASGNAPSTHILKPPARRDRFPGIEVNEHVCLNLARHLGIPAAASRVKQFGDEVAIVVERFDREPGPAGVVRLHQEDTCQALGVPPSRKYQYAQGPGFSEMAHIARANSADADADLQLLLDAAALNWLIGGTDAHAKNYSWFISRGDEVRLTPLYDLISSLPYWDIEREDLRLAMTIGGENRLLHVRRRHWEQFADVLGAEQAEVLRYVRDLCGGLPEAIDAVVGTAASDGLDPAVLGALRDALIENTQRCDSVLS